MKGLPLGSLGSVAITPGRPHGQRQATPATARGSRPNWSRTVATSADVKGWRSMGVHVLRFGMVLAEDDW